MKKKYVKVIGTIATLICAVALNQLFGLGPECAFGICQEVIPAHEASSEVIPLDHLFGDPIGPYA